MHRKMTHDSYLQFFISGVKLIQMDTISICIFSGREKNVMIKDLSMRDLCEKAT